MFTVIGFMLAGWVIGYLLRQHLRGIPTIIMILICLLLFLLGWEVGSNPHIMSSLMNLGLEACLIATACVMGSCFFAFILWKWAGRSNNTQSSSQHEG